MAVRVPEVDFYSLHGIWGAYASLALGRVGRGAGVVLGNVKPPQRSLFVGYMAERSVPRLLPFATGTKFGHDAAAFRDDAAGPTRADSPEKTFYFKPDEIERSLSLSGEQWKAGSLSFSVISFLGEVPDPQKVGPAQARFALRPSILLRLEFDNRAGSGPMTGLFGMQGIRRPLSDSTSGALLGMAGDTTFGFAIRPRAGVEEVMDWSVVDAAFNGDRPLRRLAHEGGLRFIVPPGRKEEYYLALGVYRDGIVTAGMSAHAYYTCLFKDLEDVLESALDDQAETLFRAERMDAYLDSSGLSEDRQFLLSHAAHSYAANTELLLSESGEPYFVVNEGEYQMINTLDLTIDQAFWEARFSPWTLRNELDSFAERSTYEDSMGIAFTHDQGVADCFTPKGRSAYELPGYSECFSFMGYEETVNWLISSCLYSGIVGDLGWAKGKRATLSACLHSLLARDANGDGVMDRDSDRCAGGSEITTYDSLDVSLGQSRNSLYLAVKTWSACVCVEALFLKIDGSESADSRAAQGAARAIARTVSGMMLPEGFIPAIFENDNRARVIPAIEGLAYPGFCGAAEAVSPTGPYGELIKALKGHFENVLAPGTCLDAVSGGWKLSSTSRNTWLSKIFLNQYVAESVLGIDDERTRRDAVHAHWLRTGSAEFAATDQVDSSSGKDLGSRLYPRLVTSILWLWPRHR